MPQQAQIDPVTGERASQPSTIGIDPSTGERVGTAQRSTTLQQPSAMSELVDMGKAGASLIYSRMLDADPRFVYQNHDEIERGMSVYGDFKERMAKAATVKDDPLYMLMRHTGPEPFETQDKLEDFVHQMSEFAGDPVIWAPALLGSFFGPQGARAGSTAGFALDAGLRKMLADHYQKGTANSFGELANRTAATIWAAAKGGITGEAMHYASGIPVPKALGDIAGNVLRGLYQSSAMTTVGGLLDWHVPKLQDFERNAVAVTGLGLITHAATGIIAKQGLLDVYVKDGTTPEQSATKLAAQPPVKPEPPDGLRPAIRITAADGSKQTIVGDHGETHAQMAERITGTQPVSMDQLEAKPELADKVLSQPELHTQDVIDRAYELKSEQPPEDITLAKSGPADIDVKHTSLTSSRGGPNRTVHVEFNADDVVNLADGDKEMLGRTIAQKMFPGQAGDIEDVSIGKRHEIFKAGAGEHHLQVEFKSEEAGKAAYASLNTAPDIAQFRLPPESPKSGRGFATIQGDYLSRMSAKRWVKANEPDVHAMWADTVGDEKAEFHSDDYANARQRVAQRNVLEGEHRLDGVSGELQEFLARNREELNEVKAGNRSNAYGNTVIRSTYVGPENMVRAVGEQAAGHIAKLLPDVVDREAISFMRDYRDDPDALRQMIERVRSGDNEQLQRMIPAMERALEPTPKMLEADKLFTDYFKQANDLRTQFVGTTSSIDPERYSPRNFMRVEDEQEQGKGGGAARFNKRSPHDIQREYLHLLDPLESGDIQSRSFDAVDQLRTYGDRLARSVATSVFQMELKNTELGKFGAAGQVPSELRQQGMENLTSKEIEQLGGIPKSWIALPGTEREIVIDGKVVKKGLMVPPKIAEAMQPILERDVLSGAQYWKIAKLAQAYIKSVELGLSLFHMRAMAISYMNNNGLSAYRDALLSDNNSPEFEAQERKAALYGLTTTKTGTPIEAYRGLKPSSMESRDTLLRKPIEYVDKAFKGVTKATFEVAQRKFKVLDFSAKEAQWLAKHSNATDTEYGSAMRSISKEVNAVYGGLNWEVMGVSKNFQAVARMFLLAPDWTFSNVANLKYAIDPRENSAGGNAARAFWLKSFVTGYAMTQGMSIFVSGQSSDQFDKVYLGKDGKGKKMYSSMFFVGAPKDAIGLVNSTMKYGFPAGALNFAANKASPLVGTGVRELENKDWQGKPITKRTDTFGEKTGKELGFAAEQLVPAPFALKDMAQTYLNPNQALTYKDFLASLAGASVYHEGTKQQGVKLQGVSSGRGTRKGFHLAGTR